MKIKDLPKVDLPREKLERYGVGKLSEAELLGILLGTGTKGTNVLELAKIVLTSIKKIGIENITAVELQKIHGLGKAKVSIIMACLELGRRLLKDKKAEVILSPENVWENMADIRNSKKEHFVIFYLDSRNQEIQKETISIGTVNESLVHPREVFELAVKNNCSTIIVSHNHPSGNPEASQADIDITRKLVQAGKILGITVTDHVIVTKDSYLSIIHLI